MDENTTHDDERDELESLDGELLPAREAMSIITPGYDRAVPVDAIAPEPLPEV